MRRLSANGPPTTASKPNVSMMSATVALRLVAAG